MREVYELVAEKVKNSLTSMCGNISEKILHNSLSSLMMIQRLFSFTKSCYQMNAQDNGDEKKKLARARAWWNQQ